MHPSFIFWPLVALTTLSRAREFDSLHLARNLPERWVSGIAPLTPDFQMPDRCFLEMCDTAPSCSKPSATRWGMIFQCNVIVIMFAVCYECVMNVLWKFYESVMRVLWERYESVMKVLWMCYGCVIDLLWMCYGCVMGVLWMCEVCYGRVKDVCVMDEWWIFYIYCVSCIVNGIVIVIL